MGKVSAIAVQVNAPGRSSYRRRGDFRLRPGQWARDVLRDPRLGRRPLGPAPWCFLCDRDLIWQAHPRSGREAAGDRFRDAGAWPNRRHRPADDSGLAEDVAAALDHLGIDEADVFGYSTGAAIALLLVLRHPEKVRKLVLASVSYTLSGIHPGLMDGLGEMSPEMLHGSPWHDEYMQIAPRPEDFATLFRKKTEMDAGIRDLTPEEVQSIESPTLLIIGDSDLIRPEHAIEMYRLLGGGVFGDAPPGLPASQLAILPGTSHVTVVDRAELLVPMINSFLDAYPHAGNT